MTLKLMEKFGLAAGILCISSAATAQSLPPLLANLSVTSGEELVERALSDRIASTFPKDIRSDTLAKILDLDGFEVTTRGDGVIAKVTDYAFPCITSYSVTWTAADDGQVDDLTTDVSKKCV